MLHCTGLPCLPCCRDPRKPHFPPQGAWRSGPGHLLHGFAGCSGASGLSTAAMDQAQPHDLTVAPGLLLTPTSPHGHIPDPQGTAQWGSGFSGSYVAHQGPPRARAWLPSWAQGALPLQAWPAAPTIHVKEEHFSRVPQPAAVSSAGCPDRVLQVTTAQGHFCLPVRFISSWGFHPQRGPKANWALSNLDQRAGP